MASPVNEDPEFNTIQIKKLHPTFGAEISGINFQEPIPDEQFQEILKASAKVGLQDLLLKDLNIDNFQVRCHSLPEDGT